MEIKDYASALVRIGNGAPGTILATTAAHPGFPERIEIWGTTGSATLIGGSLRVATLDGVEELLANDAGTGGGANIMNFPNDTHRAVLADFIDAIAHAATRPSPVRTRWPASAWSTPSSQQSGEASHKEILRRLWPQRPVDSLVHRRERLFLLAGGAVEDKQRQRRHRHAPQ